MKPSTRPGSGVCFEIQLGSQQVSMTSTPPAVTHYNLFLVLNCAAIRRLQLMFNSLFNFFTFPIGQVTSGVTTMGSDRANPGAPNPNVPNGGPEAQAVEQKHWPAGRPPICYNVVF